MKTRGRKAISSWLIKSRRKTQKGGFLGMITAALIALGMSAGTAATTAAVAAPIVTTGVEIASGYAMKKALGGGVKRSGGMYKMKRRRPILIGRTLRLR